MKFLISLLSLNDTDILMVIEILKQSDPSEALITTKLHENSQGDFSYCTSALFLTENSNKGGKGRDKCPPFKV
jgi:hypothetical protein